MTTPQPPMPQAPPQPLAEPKPQPRNGLGITGFVLGLIGLLFSPIPFIGVIAWPLVVLGLIFSVIGFLRTRSGKATNKGLSITGIVLSVLGLGVCIVMLIATAQAVNEVTEEANRQVTVHYEVTGDAPSASVTYSTFGSEKSSVNHEDVTKLPWSKEMKTKGLIKGGTLDVSTGAEGGSVTCTVSVDGKETVSNTAKGEFAVASCDGW